MHECELVELCEVCIVVKAVFCTLCVESVVFILCMIAKAIREEWLEVKAQILALRSDNLRAQAQLKGMRSDLDYLATTVVKRKEKNNVRN